MQFLPILVIPPLLLFFNSKFTKVRGYWLLLSAYVLAKILEYFDAEIYGFLVEISGHSLKQVAAALGVYFLLISYDTRERA